MGCQTQLFCGSPPLRVPRLSCLPRVFRCSPMAAQGLRKQRPAERRKRATSGLVKAQAAAASSAVHLLSDSWPQLRATSSCVLCDRQPCPRTHAPEDALAVHLTGTPLPRVLGAACEPVRKTAGGRLDMYEHRSHDVAYARRAKRAAIRARERALIAHAC
eukprot:2266529-Pleurochrysis_carterae.AAC.3